MGLVVPPGRRTITRGRRTLLCPSSTFCAVGEGARTGHMGRLPSSPTRAAEPLPALVKRTLVERL